VSFLPPCEFKQQDGGFKPFKKKGVLFSRSHSYEGGASILSFFKTNIFFNSQNV
jgi:hypothetical protein